MAYFDRRRKYGQNYVYAVTSCQRWPAWPREEIICLCQTRMKAIKLLQAGAASIMAERPEICRRRAARKFVALLSMRRNSIGTLYEARACKAAMPRFPAIMHQHFIIHSSKPHITQARLLDR